MFLTNSHLRCLENPCTGAFLKRRDRENLSRATRQVSPAYPASLEHALRGPCPDGWPAGAVVGRGGCPQQGGTPLACAGRFTRGLTGDRLQGSLGFCGLAWMELQAGLGFPSSPSSGHTESPVGQLQGTQAFLWPRGVIVTSSQDPRS